ncbi:reverse transcriptase domain-containing protein [Tanacetum coccineum]
MRTRSQSRNLNRQQQQAPPAFVEPFNLEEPIENPAPPVVPMADNRTMAQLLQAPTEGYEDAIVIPEINANFELKHGLINLVQNKQFFGHDKEDPHAHIRYFNKITSTMRFPDIPSTSIKLMLFPFSLEGSARIWLEKEPPRSILTWDDLVSKFINQFFPPSKTTNLRNEITRFQQRFDESFYEAWDRFNDLLRACPHHGFSELHQLDTFYNALNANDQDSLNSAAGGNFLDKMPRECLRIIESKSKVCNSRNKAVVAKVSSNSSTPGISPDVAALTTEVSELKNMMKTMLIDKQKAQAPAPVKAVEQSCVTCGGAHSYRNCPATDGNVYRDNIQEYVSQAAAANFNQGNTNSRPLMVANQIRPPGQIYQPPTSQPPVYQAPPYQAPASQMQGVSKTDFENYVKANDAVLRNMKNQGQGLQNQMTNLKEMLSKFINSNTASSSSSGTLPSQTVTNPRKHVNAITTRSGKTYEGPSTPLVPTPVVSTPLKEPEQNPETSMDKVQKPSLESTVQVPPLEDHDSIFIEIPKPKAKKTVQEPISPDPNSYQPKLPYPERMKVKEKDKPRNAKIQQMNALADSGASINLLPHSIYKQLGLGALKPT